MTSWADLDIHLGAFDLNRNPATDPLPRCRSVLAVRHRPFDWDRDCLPDLTPHRLRRFPPIAGRGRGYRMDVPDEQLTTAELVARIEVVAASVCKRFLFTTEEKTR